jgi:hypothetical protein
MTVDKLLLKILNFSSPDFGGKISNKDSRVLASMATAVGNHLFITENQSKLLIKILQENCEKIPEFSEEIKLALMTPSWSKPFRHIEQVKKFYIGKNEEQNLDLFIEISFSSEIRKILSNLSKNLENLISTVNQKIWHCDLTEKNLVLLYEALHPYNFEIDSVIQNHYDTIKSWSEPEFRNQFLLTTIAHTNFHKTITADLGVQTAIDQHIINDRSVRYQYFTENTKKHGEALVEVVANRPKTRIWIDKNQHTVTEVIECLIHLKRLPLLVVFDNVSNSKYLENLEILSDALAENGIHNGIGVYFRLSNDDTGKKFNAIIADKKYNHQLDKNLKVAAVMSGKIPKFFLKNDWQPMSVIALDTKMGLRHGKTSVYTNCCDLIIEYAEEKSMLEGRKIL